MIIYKITNLINNKIYIGQSKYNNQYYLGSGLKIKRAITKYGESNFKKEIIDYCESKKEMDEKEIFWIKTYKSTDPTIGYNITNGGQGGNLGEKVRMKKSKSLKSYHEKHPEAHIGKNNPRFDNTIYKFYNIETGEIFEGFKYDLAKEINSNSSALNALILGYREIHKKWILFEYKEILTKEYFKEKKSKACKNARSKVKK
jgi:hypothetical protein